MGFLKNDAGTPAFVVIPGMIHWRLGRTQLKNRFAFHPLLFGDAQRKKGKFFQKGKFLRNIFAEGSFLCPKSKVFSRDTLHLPLKITSKTLVLQ